MRGRWARDQAPVFVGPRHLDDELGSHAVGVFELDQQQRPRRVLVNRGFVKRGDEDRVRQPEQWAAAAAAAAAAVDEEPVLLTGFLRTRGTARKPGLFVPDNDPERGRWFWYDVHALARQFPGTEPVLIELDEERPPAAGGIVRPVGRAALELPNNHLQYIVTWYGLTAALLVLFKKFIAKR